MKPRIINYIPAPSPWWRVLHYIAYGILLGRLLHEVAPW